MKVFKNRWFSKYARKEGISDEVLLQAVQDAEAGLVDADFGSGVIKQRIARPGEGKSGGYRTVILYKAKEKAFFVYGFAKSDRANIDKAELAMFKVLAKETLSMNKKALEKLIQTKAFVEIINNE